MRQARETIRLAARSSATVLVRGESGTGKEVVARAIHDLSARCEAPFVAMNCAAVAEGVLESELFGHEKGSFTGAEARRRGRFELADQGTLFLDEVAEMQPHLQAKLLRVLQERSFERVGGVTPISIDIRVVAATNRVPTEEIAAGRLREDLYYRLAVVEVVLPPLRERREDILPTAQHLLRRLRPEGDLRLSALVASALTRHDWPGNVRELSNVLERATLFAAEGEIRPEHLPPALRELCDRGEMEASSAQSTGVRAGVSLEDVERDLIHKTLASFGGNRTRTAEALGLSRRALLYKIKRFGFQER
jgi:transcriptional regulator with PAS, ATPase and Fis domain